MQIIILHALIFVGIQVFCKTILLVLGYKALFYTFYQSLLLPADWSHFVQQPWSLCTYFWLHQDLVPMLWNLAVLYGFGQLASDLLGSKHLVRLYLSGGIVGGLLFLLLYNHVPYFKEMSPYIIGNAGSLYAILISAATVAPERTLRLFFVITLKLRHVAWIMLLLAFVTLSSAQPAEGTLELGGTLVGYLYASWLLRPSFSSASAYFKRIFTRRRSNMKVTYSSKGNASKPEYTTHVDQEGIDCILDKIAATGYSSLTMEEKKQLFEASR